MLELIYIACFFIVGLCWILIKGVRENQLVFFQNEIMNFPKNLVTLIKGIPAGIAVLFVLLIRPDDSLFYFIIAGALFFCMLGDIGMEKGLIPGLPLFLVAQVLFAFGFILKALDYEITANSIILTSLATVGIVIYIILLLRYLESSDKGLGAFKLPVIIYTCCISIMLISTIFLWITSTILNILFLILGALLFVTSDSLIAIREFHHRFSNDFIIVMGTYYPAILLLSLAAIFV
ncbi:lysoplasmalogenase family protein [Candidatus Hodarchaeum mangrovi]